MARRNDKKNDKKELDWKDRFVNVGFSYNDEKEIREYLDGAQCPDAGLIICEILDNGGSVKFTHSKNDGSIFVTVALDQNHPDVGGFMFGFRYATFDGAVALLFWFYNVVLTTDRVLSYLPNVLDDWLSKP